MLVFFSVKFFDIFEVLIFLVLLLFNFNIIESKTFMTGLIMACCYLRPDGITSLTPKSVKKKLKDKKFAAGVDRFEVTEGARLLDVEMGEHIQFLIDALKPHAAELGILGSEAQAAS